MRRSTITSTVGLGLMLITVGGCFFGGPKRVEAPPFDASANAQKAMDLYDTDKDGQLNAKELKAVPSLAKAVDQIDTNGDKALSKDEIAQRITEIIESQLGYMSVAVAVLHKGKPLEGATVRFIPEQFVADLITEAQGVSGRSGVAVLQSDDGMTPGVAPGFYRVEVSFQQNGREALPAKFNSKTTLGQEVSFSNKELAMGPVVIDVG